jgi:energy-coupling factor transport system substrate-specific component
MKTTHRIILIGLLSALLVVVQVALAAIPNVELVSFLFLIYTITLPLSMSLSIALVFATLQMLVWGMGLLGYLGLWNAISKSSQ